MAYTHQPSPRRFEFKYECDTAQNRLLYTVIHPFTGKPATPSAITISVTDPGGTEVLAAASIASNTVSGSDNQYYLDLDTTDTDDFPIAEGYRCEIIFTIDSEAHYDEVYADVVYHPLRFKLPPSKLWELESELERQFAPGKTDHSPKILAAEGMIRTEIRQATTQDGTLNPARLVGSEQLSEWHRALTLFLIFTDLSNKTKVATYAASTEYWKAGAMSVLSYSAAEQEDPGDPEEIDAGGVMLDR